MPRILHVWYNVIYAIHNLPFSTKSITPTYIFSRVSIKSKCYPGTSSSYTHLYSAKARPRRVGECSGGDVASGVSLGQTATQHTDTTHMHSHKHTHVYTTHTMHSPHYQTQYCNCLPLDELRTIWTPPLYPGAVKTSQHMYKVTGKMMCNNSLQCVVTVNHSLQLSTGNDTTEVSLQTTNPLPNSASIANNLIHILSAILSYQTHHNS